MSADGERHPDDDAFAAGLESTLHRAVDDVTSSPDLRTTIEQVAAHDVPPSGSSAFAEVDAAVPGADVRRRVAAAIASSSATNVVWWRRRSTAVVVAAAVVAATLVAGALASAWPGLDSPAPAAAPSEESGGAAETPPPDDRCAVPWSDVAEHHD